MAITKQPAPRVGITIYNLLFAQWLFQYGLVVVGHIERGSLPRMIGWSVFELK